VLVVPAIDIRGGKCVRLVRGDYDRETVFGDDPASMARRWVEAGARALHLVDLDGARAGRSENDRAVEAILAELRRCDGTPPVTELGGGIRDVAAVERWLAAGLDRVVLGTVAVTEPDVVSAAASRFPGRVWVGIDARSGSVAIGGWIEGTRVDAIELARDIEARGASGIIYTDIDRDGTGAGVNAEATARLARAVSVPVFASAAATAPPTCARCAPRVHRSRASSSAARSTTAR